MTSFFKSAAMSTEAFFTEHENLLSGLGIGAVSLCLLVGGYCAYRCYQKKQQEELGTTHSTHLLSDAKLKAQANNSDLDNAIGRIDELITKEKNIYKSLQP